MGTVARGTSTTDGQPGQGIVTEVNGKTFAIFHVDGAFHAIDNTWIHRGGHVARGISKGRS